MDNLKDKLSDILKRFIGMPVTNTTIQNISLSVRQQLNKLTETGDIAIRGDQLHIRDRDDLQLLIMAGKLEVGKEYRIFVHGEEYAICTLQESPIVSEGTVSWYASVERRHINVELDARKDDQPEYY